jgi:hydroxymethylpyrimidine/phosphomethylpyrimidine kinase
MRGRILSIAGSDSGGGAGIQADIKTITALGGYAATAITALTAQNTKGVSAIASVDPEFLVEQVRVVHEDIGLDAIKIGMLHRVEIVNALADYFDACETLPPIVLDPVMIAKGGAALIKDDAQECVIERLVRRHTAVLTPNIPEAERLIGGSISNLLEMKEAARQLLAMGPEAVVMKGGHMEGPVVIDVLETAENHYMFDHPRIMSKHTHGTGCTLSSAIATGLGQSLNIHDSVERGLRYVEIAIESAPGLGHGHGPLNHGHMIPGF